MITSEIQGPGFFIFFQTEEEEERPAGGWEPHEPYKYRKRVRFKFADEEEEKVAPIIERIAAKILETKEIEADEDIELILRLRLRQERLVYKHLYLVWLIQQAEIERRHRDAIILLLLH